MRALSPEEADLWAKVTATIRPLSRTPQVAQPPQAEPDRPPAGKPAATARPPAKARSVSAPSSQRLGTGLDSSWERKLRSGSVQPDRVVDLHGHNLDRAWQAIDLALERAIDSGDRLVLLITGHQRSGEPPVERGRIRAAVHDWLAASRHASRIAAVRGAHQRHGGGGSLYIILRRR